MTDSKAASSRLRILAAATAIAVEQGPKQLTLNNVAQKCGMSKGGVMHHFPNKDALLQGMTNKMLKMVSDDSELLAKKHDDRLTITNIMRTRKVTHEKIGLHEAKILLVAAIENPALLAPMSAMMQEKKKAVMSESASEESILLWLAADGLSFQELLGISPFDESERNRLREKLINMAIALEGDRSE
ncbi:TetR/AcrR family transcriptional regulator [Alteromonas sp. C1M14]|uniref:TetR/AcrR family transcriptional regulator n=1 Tax=Alteromonas sp. C1M14 TaxID=2841567 RepID=UPI001C08A172|nr:TetR/AcrR family transcriptional regulator [Alteromonas sp. C1M14]MBU2977113.1 TetR/AcrR family transcriptional regulator [Alteromonas sp. C1M14]